MSTKTNSAINKMENKFHNKKVFLFFKSYVEDEVGRNAASLAYYLLFTLFPLLILISNAVGLIHVPINSLNDYLKPFMPPELISLLSGYLDYVNKTSSRTMLTFSIFFSVYFPYRAVRQLMDTIRISFDLPEPKNKFKFLLKQIFCAVMLPITIILSLVLIVAGEKVIKFFLGFLLPGTVLLPKVILDLWQYLRFVAAAVLMGIYLGILYKFSLDKKYKPKELLPGILFSLLVWILGSILFSFYVENFAHYSLIYGTLGAFIVLLLWLYMTSVVFILGGELNAIILDRKIESNL